MTMKKIAGFAGALVLSVLVLTGCGATAADRSGDPGKVSGRDESHWTTKSGKTTIHHYDYDLTVTRKDGTSYEIDVTESAFDHCYRGSAYPKCVDR